MAPDITRTVLTVMGMRNNACRELLIKRLELIEDVRDVDINLHRATATISHTPSCRPGDLVWAIVYAGYGVSLNGVTGTE